LNILLVEDNPVDRKAAVALLEEAGYGVEAVAVGQDAIAALEHQNFDLVLTDIRATEVIRDREKVTGRHLPIIAISRYASSGEREECLQAGMDAYLSKPIQLDQLLSEIKRLTEPLHASQERLVPELEASALTASLQLLREIHRAIRVGDVKTIRQSADALKGSITSVLAKEAFDAATALEKTEHEGDLARAQDACRRLRAAINSLNPTYAGKTED
jgi:two-component system, sensor histidine kinase and response regulator